MKDPRLRIACFVIVMVSSLLRFPDAVSAQTFSSAIAGEVRDTSGAQVDIASASAR